MKERIEQIDRSFNWQISGGVNPVIEQAIAIQQIPAPTFHEAQRAAYVERQFNVLQLDRVEIDDHFNVYGLLPGEDPEASALVVSAHTDTVFNHDTDLSIHREADRIYGPGLGDNSIGVAGILALARILREQNITPACSLWFVATTREEGLGDLGGMRSAFERLTGQVRAVINVEGLALGHIYRGGIAVRRLHISARAPGGHSWLHFGNTSAIHGIVELGAKITAIQLPGTPRTTYNIGLIEGGQSINSIASAAALWLDMRSEAAEALARLEAQVRDHIARLTTADLNFTAEVVGDRPAGSISPQHPLVQGAAAVLNYLNIPETLEIGSTDANVPLAAGCPAVTIGITRGGNAHRTDEFIEIEPVAAGIRQLTLLTLAVAADRQG